jgi:hypothetical protein
VVCACAITALAMNITSVAAAIRNLFIESVSFQTSTSNDAHGLPGDLSLRFNDLN